MNKPQVRQIDSILGGWSVTEYYNQPNQFLSSIGIDPEMPVDDTKTRPCGLIRPTAMAKFSGTEVTGVPLWFITNPKTDTTYCYASDGKVHTITNALAMGTALTTVTSSNGNGAAYYSNYIYFAKNTDVARYGPLDGTPAMTQTFWTSTLSETALTNTSYPTVNGIAIPNHPMAYHQNRLYFGDVNSAGVGVLHMINTRKVTYEGDTDDNTVPSAYNVLDFNYQWFPTCVESFGNEIAIGVIEGNSNNIKQGNAKVLFWDTLATTTAPNRIVELPDPLITAMKFVNGILYCFSGSGSGGMRISRYLGGQQFEELFYLDDQFPPFQGAVDYNINRLVWGASTTTPAVSASVMSLGSKVRQMGMGVHNILKTTSAGATPNCTAVKYIQQGNKVQPIAGWTDGSAKGLDKLSTTYGTSIWRSRLERVGRTFNIKEIRIPLAQAVAANQTITVKILTDDGSTTDTVGTINSTNYPNSERYITIYPQGVGGRNNFLVELTFSGTALATVSLPISYVMEINNE